jgi:hypothetical protein
VNTDIKLDEPPREAIEQVARANAALAQSHPGSAPERQPVHTVYGGAHLFGARAARKLGDLALAALAEHAPDSDALADALGLGS